ncbi:MAG TPA: 3-methyl-2-oxobutanoate hydroxymethyltransferase [Spirochaetota bacterium]|nr:3-methyl-2-oxobutanoate hydroxymethyltransferase [Spirochaetota bacterium]HRZ25229.1 3-methyl-2-oxobutanoate hydroxymethyltransferase [Spirochaetota bacterium]HSA14380.1 3-methyl-2-oxobutanoate hydroxymethyltransferase [Spirochaetota bacterium]
MSSVTNTDRKKGFTINDFKASKEKKIPISMLTCYDFAFAKILDNSDIDVLLVGDSLGNVIAGYSSTIPVTVDQMIYHAEIVRRGAPSKFVVIDMPFMSYHVSVEDSLRNAGRMIKESGANAVKLEGGRDFSATVKALVKASIPVMGHLGLTPQSIHKLGGYSVQGRQEDQRKTILEDAKILEDSGAFSIVLEKVPESLAKEISEKVSVPTIGIGAGRYCDGQVLVLNDMLGLDESFAPKFLKKYASLYDITKNAVNDYCGEVKGRVYPGAGNVYE